MCLVDIDWLRVLRQTSETSAIGSSKDLNGDDGWKRFAAAVGASGLSGVP